MKKTRKHIPALIKDRVRYRQGYKCQGCFVLLPPGHEMDHVIPLWAGGKDDASNLQALCGNCHNIKSRVEQMLRARFRYCSQARKRIFAECPITFEVVELSPYFPIPKKYQFFVVFQKFDSCKDDDRSSSPRHLQGLVWNA